MATIQDAAAKEVGQQVAKGVLAKVRGLFGGETPAEKKAKKILRMECRTALSPLGFRAENLLRKEHMPWAERMGAG